TGTIAAVDTGGVTIHTPLGPLRASGTQHVPAGGTAVAAVRPEHVRLSRDRPDERNVLQGTVISALFEGTRVKYRLAVGDRTVLAYASEMFLIDERLYAAIDPAHLILLPHLPGTQPAI
ncbi:MAG: TOBE domain-containing protein, partial [bacterium]